MTKALAGEWPLLIVVAVLPAAWAVAVYAMVPLAYRFYAGRWPRQ